MAPEVYKSQKYNEKADIFSLGVVYTEILTGSLLYNCVLNEKTSEQVHLSSNFIIALIIFNNNYYCYINH